MGKSAAKIRRNIARAAARGETYAPPAPAKKDDEAGAGSASDEGTAKKVAAAQKLERALAALEANASTLNSKEKRSAKRKAEAIAAEEAGCDATELLEWYERNKPTEGKKGKRAREAPAAEKLSPEEQAKFAAAKTLHDELSKLEKDEDMNAKERRSAKRRAEAIATEATGTPATELLEWYQTLAPKEEERKGKKTPYIVFVGQLAYSTTSDMLFDHIQSTLGKEHITKETTKIRLLTDAKTKKSRGMAFVEVESPEVMYECLKLHLTHLDGRRINVERSAGGGAASKKAKLTHLRESQSTHISETMDHIISGFVKSGEVDEDELDEGVIALCKRHSATVVEAALKEYVQEKKERKAKKETLGEKEEENLRNPSAFLTHMLGRIAEEGVGSSSKGRGGGRGGGGRGGGPGRGGGGRGGRGGGGRIGRGDANASILAKSGVDMSMSTRIGGGDGRGGRGPSEMSRIFPSMGRGRGRGRGYM